MAYTKLFHSIITSSLWNEDDATRIVWITMLACADKNGEVQGSVPGLARVAGVSLAACQTAIDKFLSPDPYSRTKDDDGKRIEAIPGGWLLLNHAKYRRLASREEQIEANAERQRRHRAKQARNAKVTVSNAGVTQNMHIADTETDSNSESNAESEAKTPYINDDDGKMASKTSFSMPSLDEFVDYYRETMKKADLGQHLPLHDWLLEQHSYCVDKWTDKPVSNWKSQTGRFIRLYTDYWNFTKPTEKTEDENEEGGF